MSRALPPGRRGNQKKKFEADHDALIEGIDISTPEGQDKLAAKRAAEEEAARQLEIQKQQEAAAKAKAEEEAAARVKAEEETARIKAEEEAAVAAAKAKAEAEAAARIKAEEEAAAAKAKAEAEAAARIKAEEEAAVAAAKAKAEKEAAEEEKKRAAQEEEANRQAAIAAQEKADLDAVNMKTEQAKSAKAMEEDEELKRIRLAAEEQRRKREMFLTDTDTFSNQMKITIDDKQNELKEKQAAEANRLASGIIEQSGSYAAPAREKEVVESPLQEQSMVAVEPVPTVPISTPAEEEDVMVNENLASSASKISAGAQELFATADIPAQVDLLQTPKVVEEEVLSMPTRIGGEKKKKGEKVKVEDDLLSDRGAAPLVSPGVASGGGSKITEPPTPPAPEPVLEPEPEVTKAEDATPETLSAPIVTGAAPAFLKTTTSAAPYSYIDDDDEDGDENAHTFQSPEKKAAWRAKQDDLTNKRKEFHGAVTYAFGGVFSWSMYGSTEAVDEYGAPYTEYLMRCQWGPSFEDMKPWIVAHRYSEFDRLHTEIEKLFPEYAYGAGDNKLPSLPQKDFFNNFDSAVIERRREGLENYFTVIITKLPKVLKCTLMEDFMFVRERVASIKQQMQIEGRRDGVEGAVSANADNSTWMGAAPGTENALAEGTRSTDIDDDGIVTEWNSTGMFLTADGAEQRMLQDSSAPLDDCQLGDLEEQIFEIRNMMRSFTPKQVVTSKKLSKLFTQCREQWPCLRATMSFDRSPDVSLIPRAMQVEEDLVAVQGEVKSVVAAYSMVLSAAPTEAPPPVPPTNRIPASWNPLG